MQIGLEPIPKKKKINCSFIIHSKSFDYYRVCMFLSLDLHGEQLMVWVYVCGLTCIFFLSTNRRQIYKYNNICVYVCVHLNAYCTVVVQFACTMLITSNYMNVGLVVANWVTSFYIQIIQRIEKRFDLHMCTYWKSSFFFLPIPFGRSMLSAFIICCTGSAFVSGNNCVQFFLFYLFFAVVVVVSIVHRSSKTRLAKFIQAHIIKFYDSAWSDSEQWTYWFLW